MIAMQDVTVRVGEGGTLREQRFAGRLLVRRWLGEGEESGSRLTEVYLTARGQYAVYARSWRAPWPWARASPWWPWPAGGQAAGAADPGPPWPDWLDAWPGARHRLDVYPTREALRDAVPGELFEAAARAADGGGPERLDI